MKILMKKNAIQASLIAACAMGVMTFTTNSAQACSEEAYIGSICATANNYCPDTYAEANGDVLPVSSNQALYALLGSTFGGNGTTTFGLPDLRSRTPVAYGGTLELKVGDKTGAEKITLTEAQMAAHIHSASFIKGSEAQIIVPASTKAAEKEIPAAGDLLAATPVNGYIPADDVGSTATFIAGLSNTSGGTVAIGNTGSAAPFSIISPQTAVRYCIKMTGLWPPRS